MAAKRKDKDDNEETSSSIKIIGELLKNNKEDHYNFEETVYYKSPSSSMILNAEMQGGVEPGAHRAIGSSATGKTSAVLDFMYNFLKDTSQKRKGLYVKAEGRLSANVQKRSGITFVENYEDWEPGTCLIIDSNVFEFVFTIFRNLIMDKEEKVKFFFVIDSIDTLAKRDDLAKPFEEAQQVAGGALLTSVFFKKVSVALSKRGHILFLISQFRDSIKIDKYGPQQVRQGSSNGGHALEHASGWVIEFQQRFQDDLIRENDEKNGKIIGHMAKCKIIKGDNENYLKEVRYPICYGRNNANSIWKEREIIDSCLMYQLLTRAGAWYRFDPVLLEEMNGNGLNVPEQIQGLKSVYKLLEDSPQVTAFLGTKFKILD